VELIALSYNMDLLKNVRRAGVSRLIFHVLLHRLILLGGAVRGPDNIVRIISIHPALESGTRVDH